MIDQYFSHDFNARVDEKIKLLLRRHGLEGYGLFWAIVEDLYQNGNSMKADYDGIAYDIRTREDLVKSVIEDFGLFTIKGGTFSSKSVALRMKLQAAKSKKGKDAALARWNKEQESSVDQEVKNENFMQPAMQEKNYAMQESESGIAKNDLCNAINKENKVNKQINEEDVPPPKSMSEKWRESQEQKKREEPKPSFYSLDLLTIEQCREKYDSFEYAESRTSIAMSKRIKLQHLPNVQDAFDQHLRETGKIDPRAVHDYAKHFKFWVDKVAQAGELELITKPKPVNLSEKYAGLSDTDRILLEREESNRTGPNLSKNLNNDLSPPKAQKTA